MDPALTDEEILQLTPQQLVNKLWDKRIRLPVIRALVGGLTGTELRQVQITPEARQALIDGLGHESPRVRWWCLQLIDHVADEGLLQHAVALLDDPVQRVRRHAAHALTCERCKADPTVVEAGRAGVGRPRGFCAGDVTEAPADSADTRDNPLPVHLAL